MMEKIILMAMTIMVSTKFSKFRCALAVEDTRCSDGWVAFKDQKCVLISSQSGLQTHEDAEVICRAYANESNNIPELLTVRSYEEQEFLHSFLFVKNKLIDHVWLGLKEGWKVGVFEWNDGSDIYFTNWAEQNVSDDHHKCVQMESGEANDPPGIWVKVNCQKRNSVVCEKLQNCSTEKMQAKLVTLQLQLQNTITEQMKTEKEFNAFKKSAEEEIERLKLTPGHLPIGSIYVQLAGQSAPATLWPSDTWQDISSSYAGLFFRVVGGTADEFGVTQNATSPHLTNVEWRKDSVSRESPKVTALPSNGNWSDFVYTGERYSGSTTGIRFQLSSNEVRPENQAVKIWLRIK